MTAKSGIDNLNTLSKKKIKRYFKAQKKIGWDFYAERAFVENLFSQRFNYFLIVYSLFVTATATVKDEKSMTIVLILGILLTFTIWLTLYRAYIKLIVNLKILHNLPMKGQVFALVNKEINSYCKIKRLFGVNNLIGIYIPLFCVLSLMVGLVLVLSGHLEPFNK
jgi:hypothetical protein